MQISKYFLPFFTQFCFLSNYPVAALPGAHLAGKHAQRAAIRFLAQQMAALSVYVGMAGQPTGVLPCHPKIFSYHTAEAAPV